MSEEVKDDNLQTVDDCLRKVRIAMNVYDRLANGLPQHHSNDNDTNDLERDNTLNNAIMWLHEAVNKLSKQLVELPKTTGDLAWALAEIQAGRWVAVIASDAQTCYRIDNDRIERWYNNILACVNAPMYSGDYESAPDPRKENNND